MNSFNSKKNQIILSQSFKKNWQKQFELDIKGNKYSQLEIFLGKWKLTCNDINYIINYCKRLNKTISNVFSSEPESIISASNLGLNTSLILEKNTRIERDLNIENSSNSKKAEVSIIFHQGTLHAGEIIEVESDILLIGDVNPGAIVRATGNIMIWGRLLGIAHAGKEGNHESKITALQLRPVQLRIADKIAKGPKEKPEEGLAEEAQIQGDVIVIKPARTR